MGSQLDIRMVANWSESQVRSDIEQVLSVLERNITGDEEEVLLCVKLALENVVPCLPLCDVEEKLFQKVCQIAEVTFTNTLAGIESMQNLKGLSQTQCNSVEACSGLLSITVTLMENFLRCCDHLTANNSININYVISFVKSSFSMLEESLSHYRRGEMLYGDMTNDVKNKLEELHTVTCKFFNKFATLLTNHMKFETVHDDDCTILAEVIQKLSILSVNCLKEDVKMLAECWKLFLYFIENYKEYVVLHVDSKLIVQALSQMIFQTFEKYLTADVNVMKTLMVSLKISSFLLKILVKICGYLSQHFAEELNDVVELLFLLYRCTPSYLTSEGIPPNLVAEIHKLLVIGADPLLNQIYCERVFLDILRLSLVKSVAENPYGTLMLLLSLMKKMHNSELTRETYLAADLNLLEWAFTSLSACHNGMICGRLRPPGSTAIGQRLEEADLYEVLLKGTAVFILTARQQEFPQAEQTLLRNVLTCDPWRATLAADLWCLVARYADAQICHSTLDVLIAAHEMLGSDRPEVVNLKRVISRLLPLCDAHYLQNLNKKYPLQSCPKFWGITHSVASGVGSELLKDTLPAMETVLTERNVDSAQLENIINNLHILASVVPTLSPDALEPVLPVLTNLWALNPSTSLSSSWWSQYVVACAAVTAAVFPRAPPEIMCKVLSCIDTILPKLVNNSHKLSVLSILNSLTTVSIPNCPQLPAIIRYISSLYRQLLSDPATLVQETTLKSFSDFAHVTSHIEVIANAVADSTRLQEIVTCYLQKELKNARDTEDTEMSMYVHTCSEPEVVLKRTSLDEDLALANVVFHDDVLDAGCQPKRAKLDNAAKVQSAISRLWDDSQFIAGSVKCLNYEQKRQVSEICELLQKTVK